MFNPEGKLTINSIATWMDGGTITLSATDENFNKFEIEFTQKMILEKSREKFHPGSLILNGKEIDVRSNLENKIITHLRKASYSSKIDTFDKQLITESVSFVLSSEYIKIAEKFNRLK